MYIVQTVVRFLNQGQLQLFVGGLMYYLRYLRIAVFNTYCAVLFALLVFVLSLVCPMLPVSVDCSFLSVPSVFSNVYFLFFHMVDVAW